MHVYLHIGPHKTGSTAFQSVMAAHGRMLKAAGWLYPLAGRNHFGHHRLAFAMRGYRDRARGDTPVLSAELAALRGELESSTAKAAVLSSEVFFGAPAAAIAELRAALPGTVTVVAVLRHPMERFFSAYNQRTKDPRNPLVSPLAECIRKPVAFMPELNMAPFLGRWRDAFGKENLVLLPYDGRRGTERLLAAIGCDVPLRMEGAVANRSLSPRSIEIIRLAKSAGADDATIHALSAEAETAFAGDPKFPALPPAQTRWLLRRLCPLYDPVFEEYLRQPNSFSPDDIDKFLGAMAPELSTADLVTMLADRKAARPRSRLTRLPRAMLGKMRRFLG